MLARLAIPLLLALVACKDDTTTDSTVPGPADADADGYDEEVDCDDLDPNIHPDAAEVCDGVDNNCDGVVDADASDVSTWYADADGDGYGDAGAVLQACETPEGFVGEAGDCDDGDAAYHPGAPEDDCADPADYNCDGSTGYADADGDGYAACEECDDGDAAVHPDAVEVCDEVDNDCDGLIDDADDSLDASTGSTWYSDTDGDGYGDPSASSMSCEAGEGQVADSTDCDDGDPDVNPGAEEVCNDVDDDCDGDTDGANGATPADAATWYADADGDGYGDPSAATQSCDAPSGAVDNDADCDDGDAGLNPDTVWYLDFDSDGYGGADYTLTQCAQPNGYILQTGDCDDGDGDSFPGGVEVCDGADNDCNGSVDDGASDTSDWYTDADGDGYGDASAVVQACDAPTGTVSDSSDCDDSEAAVYPGAAELRDGLDNDCDGAGYDGDYAPSSGATLAGGLWEFTRFEIPSGVTITVTGSDALEVYVLEDAVIDGRLDLYGADGRDHGAFQSSANPGGVGGGGGGGDGGDGGCYNCGQVTGTAGSGDAPGAGASSSGVGGGGGGGGGDGAGDDGQDGSCPSSRCGSTYTVAGGAGGSDLATGSAALQPGSGGGGGGYGVADNGDGGGGGGGGGALYLQAASVDVAGSVDCSGGDGGGDTSGRDGGSGGGGSGGTLWLQADTVTISGTLRCEGGAGGTTVIGGSAAQGGFGGDGADGFIWIGGASVSVSGAVSPAYQTP